MPRCKTCGTVYSAICDCCPKCQCPTEDEGKTSLIQDSSNDRKNFVSWILLAVGICAFICCLYLVYSVATRLL